jgi:mannose/cellobiose epimerase-like protein (N-acyl-D-glucosamine 2-epimerase family)
MNRRAFLTVSSSGTAALLAGLTNCGGPDQKEASLRHQAADSPTDIGKLAGLTLSELKKQYEYDLFEDFLPFMDKHVIDHEYGGYMCNTDRDGTNITKNKRIWYEGRGIWVYSFLYNKLDSNPKHLEIAKKSVEFILKNKPSGDNLWHPSFTREGTPIGESAKRVYGDLFVANGLSEYSKATGEDRYWDMAKEIMLKCLKISDRPDYYPEAAQSYLGEDAPLLPGARVLGHWMVLLRLVTQMLKFSPDPDVEAVADRCLDAIMNFHYNPEFGLINEIINHDMSRPQDELSKFVYTGHAIETLWMVMFEAARRKDKSLFDLAAERLRRHVEVAWDDVYGGTFRSLDHVNKNIWKLDKVLWLQEEVLIGSLFVVEHTEAQWAKDMFARMFDYVQDKFPLKQYGFPIWILGADRKVTFERHATRVGNFHHPRHLMLNLLSIDRLIKRKGKVSRLFS